MSTQHANISADRECDHCGYNLKGLPQGGNCPECGKPIRRQAIRTSGMMSEEAPTRFVKKLRTGFALASTAIILTVLSIFTGRLAELINLGASLLWIAGIYIITLPRPGRGSIRPDKVLDNDRLRLTIRLLNLAWPVFALASAALAALSATASGGPAILVAGFTVIRAMVGIVAWLGMIPTSIYLAELAYWSANDTLANRMRGAAWILAIVGTIVAVMTGFGLLLNSGTIPFIMIFPSILVFATMVVYNFTFLQMTHVMHWVINHQQLAAGAFERKEERRKREEQYKGRIVDELYCEECGYDLMGLEQGGKCPECGTSYSIRTGMSVRDPATTPSYHDNTDLEVEQGESKGVFFNDQLDAYGKPKASGVPYTPATEVPDDGEIPLAMGDEDDPTLADNTKAKKSTPPDDIDGIEPISLA